MEEIEKRIKNKEMIKTVYKAQEEVIDKIIQKINKETKEQLKEINIEKIMQEAKNPNEVKEIFNKIEDNYNIKISKYNEEIYKQGFIDGVNLIINCLKKNEL